ncbi:MAG: hypothetical protein JWM56_815 [Candidatus Peribacteria bacterium]|nr:hypothetical protein [Candidatus Peribacteria bacterium]
MEQFMVLLGDHYDQTAQKIEETKEELTQKITEAKVEAIQHSNVLIEDLKHDFIGFSKDKFKLHDEQIAELQTHAGIR